MVAIDVAVVSPLRRDMLAKSGLITLAAAETHADIKAERDQCERACRDRGVSYRTGNEWYIWG